MLLRYIYVLAFICIFFGLPCKAQQVQWLRPINGYDNTDIIPQFIYTDSHNDLYLISGIRDTFIIEKDTIIPDSSVHSRASTLTAITRYDSIGQILSTIEIRKTGFTFDVRAIVVDELKNIYAAGQYKSSRESNMLLKCDSTGKIIWMRSAKGNVAGQGISLDENGNIYVTGYIYDSFRLDTFHLHPKYPAWNSFVSKFDTSGKVKWVKFFYNRLRSNSEMAHTHGNLIGNNGNLYVVGHFFENGHIDTFSVSSMGRATILMSLDTADGKVNFLKLDSTGSAEKYYLNEDRWGNILTFGLLGLYTPSLFTGSGKQLNYTDQLANHGMIYGSGMNRQGEVLTAFSDYRYMNKIGFAFTDEEGNIVSRQFLDLKNAWIYRIIPDLHGQFFICGRWQDTFAYKGDTVLRVSKNYFKMRGQFVGRITGASYSGIAGEVGPKALQFDIYPNPNKGRFVIQTPYSISTKTELTLYNAVGQAVYSSKNVKPNSRLDVDLAGVLPGVYLIRLNDTGGQVFVQKFIVE